MLVDDYLPTKNGHLCFGHSSPSNDGKHQLWVSLLEKAWAKLNGNYDRIIMGTVDMGFIHLCGVPSIDYKHQLFRNRKDHFWNQLVLAFNKKHIVVSGTNDDKLKVE